MAKRGTLARIPSVSYLCRNLTLTGTTGHKTVVYSTLSILYDSKLKMINICFAIYLYDIELLALFQYPLEVAQLRMRFSL